MAGKKRDTIRIQNVPHDKNNLHNKGINTHPGFYTGFFVRGGGGGGRLINILTF